MKFSLLTLIGAMLLSMAIWAAMVFVAAHFVQKYW